MGQPNYTEVDKIIADANSAINFFHFLLPINFQEENIKFKEQFLSKKFYNPQYIYRNIDEEAFYKIRHNLNKLSFDNDSIGVLYQNTIKSIHNDLNLLESIGNSRMFTELGKFKCGKPNMEYVNIAKDCLRLEDKTELNKYLANDLKNHLDKCINYYSFKWNVEIRNDMPSKVRVDSKAKNVYVNANYKYSEKDIKRLCVHEISTHVLRAENGSLRKLAIFEHCTSNSSITEEGLALYNEEIADVRNISTYKLYAARFLSSINMDTMCFYELVREIDPFIGLDNAIYVVARIKIGLQDTNEIGGYINDFIYFQGYQDVKKAITMDSTLYEKLYFGSIALTDIKLLEKEILNELSLNKIILPNLSIV